ncbi:MAG: hypothetical protein HOE27_01675 [Cryomorphaceae bacterium]|nr:hypothetical protein [Cryomorphaceae bacterium]
MFLVSTTPYPVDCMAMGHRYFQCCSSYYLNPDEQMTLPLSSIASYP